MTYPLLFYFKTWLEDDPCDWLPAGWREGSRIELLELRLGRAGRLNFPWMSLQWVIEYIFRQNYPQPMMVHQINHNFFYKGRGNGGWRSAGSAKNNDFLSLLKTILPHVWKVLVVTYAKVQVAREVQVTRMQRPVDHHEPDVPASLSGASGLLFYKSIKGESAAPVLDHDQANDDNRIQVFWTQSQYQGKLCLQGWKRTSVKPRLMIVSLPSLDGL